MARTRVPVKGSIGKAILSSQNTTVVQQTIVQQAPRGAAGVGSVAVAIWPLIQQVPQPVLDLAALSTAGVTVFDGTDIITRAIAVSGPLNISNPTGAAGNPTIGFTGVATNQVLAGPTPSFRSLTTADIPTLPVSKISGISIALADLSTNAIYGISGSPITTGVGTLDITLLTQAAAKVFAGPVSGSAAAPTFRSLVTTDLPTIPATQISGLATVATTGLYNDLTSKPTLLTSPLTTKGDLWGFDAANDRIPVGTDTYVLTADSTKALGVKWAAASTGSGTVTSVGIADLSSTPIYAVSTTPITTLGTLDITLLTQSANKIFAGPTTGSAAQPTFRSLITTDIPTLPAGQISGLATVATTGAYSDLSGLPGSALTKVDDTNVTATLGGTPATALLHAASITLGWTGQLSVARGGSGAATLTGYLKGNGTSAFTAAATVPLSDLANQADQTAVGNVSGGSAAPVALTKAQLTTLINAFTSSLSGATPASGGGTSNFLRADGTWAAPPSGATGANPSATYGVNLAGANGAAASFLRSDAVLKLDQSIAPTWTGTHLFSAAPTITVGTGGVSIGYLAGSTPLVSYISAGAAVDNRLWLAAVDGLGDYILETSNDAVTVQRAAIQVTRSGVAIATITLGNATDLAPIYLSGAVTVATPTSGPALTVTGPAAVNVPAVNIFGSSTAGSANGLFISAGAGNANDRSLDVLNTAQNVRLFGVFGDGHFALGWNGSANSIIGSAGGAISGYGPSAAAYVDMSPDASSFTGVLTGMTATVNSACVWSRQGNQVTLVFGAAVGTSNANTFTVTGLPAAIRPVRTQMLSVAIEAMESSSALAVNVSATVTASSGTVTFSLNGLTTGWGSSLGKGIASAFSVTYLLN